ncbi:RluA family pseudouridine synthase [Alkalicoccus urumqiensis]|uniref:Pseudouridine synthase n=1 Tax=Alkalicoccus urumqiensis TaxID=1548213 RepID=A0A2P6MGB2_ALKUR|nr:RluA family pseudouridine synthase [Alkalicoccus urumqiensis]PRO65303.1 RluA family pseudouridine synthase [Alkalicoccus urumqiensis]
MNEYHYNAETSARLDKWLTQESGLTRSSVQDWIKREYILVNGEPSKQNYKLAAGDVITVEEPQKEELEVTAENLHLDVVYEDSDVIVVNKPRGMVVHPAPGHPNGTLVNGLLYHCTDLSGINGVIRPGIVHRIDKDTSGLIMAAKNDTAHESLVSQLKDKKTLRRYEAIVQGVIPHDKGTVDAPIGRDPDDRQKMTVTEKNARDAVTHFTVLDRFERHTHVACELETGRTHQIRVHMRYIEFPIVGDPKYGSRKKNTFPIEGQALHAAVLGFTHPSTGEFMEFQAPVPEDFQACLSYASSLGR